MVQTVYFLKAAKSVDIDFLQELFVFHVNKFPLAQPCHTSLTYKYYKNRLPRDSSTLLSVEHFGRTAKMNCDKRL